MKVSSKTAAGLAIVAATLGFAASGAQARVARHVATPPAQQMQGDAPEAGDVVRAAHPTQAPANPLCTMSYMQVPSFGGGLVWRAVEDCDGD